MLQSYLRLRTAGSCAAVLVGALAFTACDKDADSGDQAIELQAVITDENEDGHTDRIDYGDADQVEDHVDGLALELESATPINFLLPDGSYAERVQVGGDVALTPEQFEEAQLDGLEGRQYHTNNLVSTPRTINVLGYTGGNQGLRSTTRTALEWAVNNYKRLNTNLTFTLTYGTSNYSSYDIVVYRNPDNGNAGGQAEFPSGGRPGQYIQIWRGLDNYNTNTQEHVVTHEMGHALGLRHTDYATRQSCGGPGESAGGSGANYIPGTPSGYDANSVMLACFGNEDGEFGYYDQVALEYLY